MPTTTTTTSTSTTTSTTTTTTTTTLKIENKLSHGYILTNTPIPSGQNIEVCYSYRLYAGESNGSACLTIKCKPSGLMVFLDKCFHVNAVGTVCGTGLFNMNFGDEICYCTNSSSLAGMPRAISDFYLVGVNSSIGLTPSISVVKNGDGAPFITTTTTTCRPATTTTTTTTVAP